MPAYFSSEAVRLVTLAPELPGALELIAALVDRGVAVSLGHSGAAAEVTRRAFDLGAGLVTHVFNGMAPIHHRAPGLAGAVLADDRALVGVIADGRHVDPLVLELVRRAAGPRVILVSDSTPAAAAPPGSYRMAGVEIASEAGGAALTAEGRLAGSALTLDVAIGNWASMTDASLGEAIRAATDTPAAVLGLASGLRAGSDADVVVLDDAGSVERVMRSGRWLA